MKMTFRKTLNMGNGFRLTFSKSGVSISTKVGPMRITRKANGNIRKTINIPGTGVSIYDERKDRNE